MARGISRSDRLLYTSNSGLNKNRVKYLGIFLQCCAASWEGQGDRPGRIKDAFEEYTPMDPQLYANVPAVSTDLANMYSLSVWASVCEYYQRCLRLFCNPETFVVVFHLIQWLLLAGLAEIIRRRAYSLTELRHKRVKLRKSLLQRYSHSPHELIQLSWLIMMPTKDHFFILPNGSFNQPQIWLTFDFLFYWIN